MKYIYRIDYGVQHCYQVTVGSNLKERISKAFFDGKHGGKRNALKAAKLYRDKALKKIGHIIEKRKVTKRTYGKNIGEYWHKNGEWQYLYVRVTYYSQKKKKQYSKTFGATKHGYDEAIRLAKQWRKHKLAAG